MGGQSHAATAVPTGKRTGTHSLGGWVGLRTGLEASKKMWPPQEFLLFSLTTSSTCGSLSRLSCILHYVFTVQHTQHKHPRLRRDSNPQSHQAIGHRPSPCTASLLRWTKSMPTPGFEPIYFNSEEDCCLALTY